MAKIDIKLSENALKVLEKRYLKKGVDGKPIETPEELFKRVASNIALAEKNYSKDSDIKKVEDDFYNLMVSTKFMPNSPTLMNAGNDLQQLSACFVLPIDDSMESIFESIKSAALIHKSGGGTGFSFSRIRPKNDVVLSTKGVSSGPISFMQVFNSSTEVIKQGGTRRGANMGILRVDHPDIMDFITAKEDLTQLNNFNISVAITDKFWSAMQKNENYELLNPRSKEVEKKMNARDVWNRIVDLAWKNGEPGIIFIDRINQFNPTPGVGELESTNPCGEQPLLPYEACNLGSINLSLMINDDKTFNWDEFKDVIHKSVHFLDNVIDMSKFPIQKITEMVTNNRKIGLGVMGFSDMLYKMEIPYNSDEGVKMAEDIMKFVDTESKKASVNLAKKRGIFNNWDKSIYKEKNIKIRNATTSTIAPTGTISIISSCSSGIEPLFGLAFVRNVMDNTEMIEINPVFKNVAQREGFYSEELMKEISKKGTLHGIESIPEKWKKIFVTAHDVKPEWHVKIQAAFQKYTDNAVSKTVNFNNSATKEDVETVYKLAFELGCKGVTIYRDGSRQQQVLNIDKVNKKTKGTNTPENIEDSFPFDITPRPRPRETLGKTLKVGTACGNLYVTVNEDKFGPCEVFAQIGKSGGCATAQTEATSRLVSLALRSGVSIESIVKQLSGIRCSSPMYDSGEWILSCPHAIAKAVERYIKERDSMFSDNEHRKKITLGDTNIKNVVGNCPECGAVLEHVEGCLKCSHCGYSKC